MPRNISGIKPESALDLDQRFFAVPEDMAGCFTAITRINLTIADGAIIKDHMQPEWASIRLFSTGPVQVRAPDGSTLDHVNAIATGASSAPIEYTAASGRMWGIGLLPLGWARFMNVEAASIANGAFDVRSHLAFAAFAPLANSLFTNDADDETEFASIIAHLRGLDRVPRNYAKVVAAHSALVDPQISGVTEFAKKAGLSVRTLERLCRKHFGFPPAKLLRRQRLMRSLTDFMLSPSNVWSGVIDANYHDQAHFVHEFHSFMGMTPTEYAALDSPIMELLVKERQKMLGHAAQTLDPPAK